MASMDIRVEEDNSDLYSSCLKSYGKTRHKGDSVNSSEVNIPNSEREHLILEAARTENSHIILKMIKDGASLNVCDKYKRSPLHIAVLYNKIDVISCLLEHGCSNSVDDIDTEGNTTVHYAAMRSDGIDVLKWLKSNGGNLNKKNIYGKCPLHYALESDILKFFIENSDSLNDTDKEMKTVLHYIASKFNKKDEVLLLVKHGIDVNICDIYGRTALIYGCLEGSHQLTECLAENSKKTINVQDIYKNTAMHYGCRRNVGKKLISCLIRNGAVVNLQNAFGKTPLMEAIERQHYDIVELLLKNNAEVNVCDSQRRIALHYAVLYETHSQVQSENATGEQWLKNSDIIRMLVQKGAKVGHRDCQNMTPLHYACLTPTGCHLVETLVNFGADANRPDEFERYPIDIAVQNRNVEIVRFLLSRFRKETAKCHNFSLAHILAKSFRKIKFTNCRKSVVPNNEATQRVTELLELLCENGFEINGVDANQQSVIHHLCASNMQDLVSYALTKTCDVNLKDKDGNTPLHVALQHNASDIISDVLKKGANVFIVNGYGQLPIHLACRYASKSTLDLFTTQTVMNSDVIELRRNLTELKDLRGKSLLHFAAENKESDVFTTLLNLKIDPTSRDKDGKSALHYGGKYLTEDNVDHFVMCGGSVNEKDSKGCTALHYAATSGNVSLIKGLLKNGGIVNETDRKGTTPLKNAVLHHQKRAVATLLDFGAEKHMVIHNAVHNCANEVLNLLLEDSCPLPINKLGQSPLHLACEANNTEAVILLLQKEPGKKILNATDSSGKSALHIASQNGNRKIVYLLSINGADLDLKDLTNKTALHLSVQNLHTSTILLLLHHGADVNAKDCDGKTPLHISVQKKQYHIGHLLLRHNAFCGCLDKVGKTPGQYTEDKDMISLLTAERNFLDRSFLECNANTRSNSSIPYHGNICLLEMQTRSLATGEYIYRPTYQGWKTIVYLKEHVPVESLVSVNFLVYLKNISRYNTYDEEGLMKYACLFLIGHFESMVPVDIARQCHDLRVLIAYVENKYNLPNCTIEHLIQQIKIANKNTTHANTGSGLVHNISSGVGISEDDDKLFDSGSCGLRLENGANNVYSSNGKCKVTKLEIKRDGKLETEFSKNRHKLLSFLKKELIAHGFQNEIERKFIRSDLQKQANETTDKQDECGWTPLHHAILLGEDELVIMLLKHETDVNILTKDIISTEVTFPKSHFNKSNLCKRLSPLLLATMLKRRRIARWLAEEDVKENDVKICIQLSLGENIEIDILEGVCRQLERHYSNISLRAYPGYSKTSPFDRILFGLSPKVFATTNTFYKSLKVKVRNPDFFEDDENLNEVDHENDLTEKDCKILQDAIEMHGPRLWQCHRNLNVITGASLMKQNEKKFVATIVLYVTITDFIPLNERQFPEKLQMNEFNIDVVVREGNAVFGPLDHHSNIAAFGSDSLRVGTSIGCKGGGSGTMGPVVNLGEKGLGFISCAHIFFEQEIRKYSKVAFDLQHCTKHGLDMVKPTEEEIEIRWREFVYRLLKDPSIKYNEVPEIFKNSDSRICGRVLKAVFNTDYSVGIDAVLVQITDENRKPIDGTFRAVNENQLKLANFNQEMTFYTGKIWQSESQPNESDLQMGTEVVKYGAASGFTRGSLTYSGSQVKIAEEKLSLYCCEDYNENLTCSHPKQEYIMKGQYIVKSEQSNPFFLTGDSGAGVFAVDRKNNNNLSCVGIAIGLISGGRAIVTPIKNVLKAFDDVKLMTFPSSLKRGHSNALSRMREDEDPGCTEAKCMKLNA